MISQTVSSIILCSPLPSGTGELQAWPLIDVVFPPLPLSALSSSPFHCALLVYLLSKCIQLYSHVTLHWEHVKNVHTVFKQYQSLPVLHTCKTSKFQESLNWCYRTAKAFVLFSMWIWWSVSKWSLTSCQRTLTLFLRKTIHKSQPQAQSKHKYTRFC